MMVLLFTVLYEVLIMWLLKGKKYLNSNGAQYTLPQNAAPWHIEYFKQKQKDHSYLLLAHPSSLKQVIKLQVRVALPIPKEKSIFISKDKGTPRI